MCVRWNQYTFWSKIWQRSNNHSTKSGDRIYICLCLCECGGQFCSLCKLWLSAQLWGLTSVLLIQPIRWSQNTALRLSEIVRSVRSTLMTLFSHCTCLYSLTLCHCASVHACVCVCVCVCVCAHMYMLNSLCFLWFAFCENACFSSLPKPLRCEHAFTCLEIFVCAL